MSKSKGTRRQAGLLPGESRRRSLVTVTRTTLGGGSDAVGRETHNYIVETRRLDGLWGHSIEYRGQVWVIPGKVAECIAQQRQAIITEERSRRAKDNALAQANKALSTGDRLV